MSGGCEGLEHSLLSRQHVITAKINGKKVKTYLK